MTYEAILLMVTVLGAIAVAAERATELTITLFKLDTWLFKQSTKTLVYQLIAGVYGSIIYVLNSYQLPILNAQFSEYFVVVIVGLMVSGGAGFWHTLLGLIANLKTK